MITPRQLEAAVLRRPLAGPVDQALDGGLCSGPLSQLPELRVGPAPPLLPLGGAVALGGGVEWVGVMGSWGLVAWQAWGIPLSPVKGGCVGIGGVDGYGLAGTRAP